MAKNYYLFIVLLILLIIPSVFSLSFFGFDDKTVPRIESGLATTSTYNFINNTNDTFWNRTGTNLYLSNTNDFVGIGTTTPRDKLSVFGDISINTMTIGGNATLTINSELNKDSCINLTEGNAYGFKICNDGSGSNELRIGNYLTDRNYMIIDRDTGITTFLNTTKTTLSTDGSTVAGYMGVRLGNDNRYIKIGNNGSDTSHILFDDNDKLTIGMEDLYSSNGDGVIELMTFKREGGTDLPLIGIGTSNPTQQLDVIGNTNISGRLYNTVPHLYGIASTPQLNPVINIWRNITWNATTSYANGNISFIDTKTVEIKEAGDYKIIFGLGVVDSSASPNAIVGFRITKNGVQVIGSYFQTYTSKQSASYWVEHFTYADDLEVGDKLNMQYISDKTTVSINSMQTWNTGTPKVAYGYIERTLE